MIYCTDVIRSRVVTKFYRKISIIPKIHREKTDYTFRMKVHYSVTSHWIGEIIQFDSFCKAVAKVWQEVYPTRLSEIYAYIDETILPLSIMATSLHSILLPRTIYCMIRSTSGAFGNPTAVSRRWILSFRESSIAMCHGTVAVITGSSSLRRAICGGRATR